MLPVLARRDHRTKARCPNSEKQTARGGCQLASVKDGIKHKQHLLAFSLWLLCLTRQPVPTCTFITEFLKWFPFGCLNVGTLNEQFRCLNLSTWNLTASRTLVLTGSIRNLNGLLETPDYVVSSRSHRGRHGGAVCPHYAVRNTLKKCRGRQRRSLDLNCS